MKLRLRADALAERRATLKMLRSFILVIWIGMCWLWREWAGKTVLVDQGRPIVSMALSRCAVTMRTRAKLWRKRLPAFVPSFAFLRFDSLTRQEHVLLSITLLISGEEIGRFCSSKVDFRQLFKQIC